MNRRITAVLIVLFLPVFANASNVTDLVAQPQGTYILKIDGKNFVALPDADAKQAMEALKLNDELKNKLAECTAKLERYQSLTNQYDELKEKYTSLANDYKNLTEDSVRLNGEYSVAANKLVILNQDYGKLVKDYDGLTEKYRDIAIRSHPRNPLDVGLGAINVDHATKGVVMVGAGTQILNADLRAWIFGGQDTYGVILGSSF